MKELNNKEMMLVEGGANWLVVGSIVAGLISFISGILSGYSNPVKCNN